MNASISALQGLPDFLVKDVVGQIILHNANPEPAVRLALQLFGAEPCPKCDYIQKHCRCAVKPTN